MTKVEEICRNTNEKGISNELIRSKNGLGNFPKELKRILKKMLILKKEFSMIINWEDFENLLLPVFYELTITFNSKSYLDYRNSI